MAKLNLKGAMGGIKKAAPFAGGLILGGVASYKIAPMVVNMVPIADEKKKNLVVYGLLTVGGLFLFATSKDKMGLMAGVGAGMVGGAGLKLVGTLAPNLGISGGQYDGRSEYIMIDATDVQKPVMGSQIAGAQIAGAQITGDMNYYGKATPTY